jgi:hypothetical protein
MISVVVVGRNDNHGYNLSKRVSSSLNSMAQMLSEGDEIIFVDWNTPTGYPVMPVSIKDDLLPKTKSLLRVIRVPQSLHELVSEGSNRALIEPLARNVGIRRASSGSKWILSTNTDILFASPSGKNFRQIFKDLDESLWLTFRFEIPEFVWEELDRRNPIPTTELLLGWYRENSILNRIRVDSAIGANFAIPDGVGDFQLATKSLWEKTTGFPEEMKKGWHVDTRLTLQMERVSVKKPQLVSEEDLIIFHQNHLRNSTTYHETSEANSLLDVKNPYSNSSSWGLSENRLEEKDLNGQPEVASMFPLPLPSGKAQMTLETFDLSEISKRLDYNLARVMIFLADELSILAKGSLVHCFTANTTTKLALSQVCEKFDLEISFQELESLEGENKVLLNSKVSLLILDYGVASIEPIISYFYGGQKNQIATRSGWIALNTRNISSRYASPGTRVSVIRAQNWATRELARKFFSLPLFNNYTSVLSGQVITEPRVNFLEELMLRGGVASDYGLDLNLSRDGSISASSKLALRPIKLLLPIFRRLPPFVRKLSRRLVTWTIKS